MCSKGQSGPNDVYFPDRILYPMKRVGERGEGKWTRISWEQALTEIADKYIDAMISEQDGPGYTGHQCVGKQGDRGGKTGIDRFGQRPLVHDLFTDEPEKKRKTGHGHGCGGHGHSGKGHGAREPAQAIQLAGAGLVVDAADNQLQVSDGGTYQSSLTLNFDEKACFSSRLR